MKTDTSAFDRALASPLSASDVARYTVFQSSPPDKVPCRFVSRFCLNKKDFFFFCHVFDECNQREVGGEEGICCSDSQFSKCISFWRSRSDDLVSSFSRQQVLLALFFFFFFFLQIFIDRLLNSTWESRVGLLPEVSGGPRIAVLESLPPELLPGFYASANIGTKHLILLFVC
jgi:hypothetical protein